MDNSSKSWNEWSIHVLAELHRLNDQYSDIEDHIDNMNKTFSEKTDSLKDGFHRSMQELHVEIAMLKVKSGVWGLMGGLIPVLLTILIEFILNKKM